MFGPSPSGLSDESEILFAIYDVLRDIFTALDSGGRSGGSGGSSGGNVISSPVRMVVNSIQDFGKEITKAALGIGAMVAGARAFVKFFDPSLVQAFDAALKDLSAVIGLALTPIIQQATKFLHQFASVLYPIAEAILPAMRDVARSITDVMLAFLPTMTGVGSIVVELGRIFGELARDLASFVLPIVRALTTIFAALVNMTRSVVAAFGGLLGPNVQGAFKKMGEWVSRAAVAFAALTFRIFGLNDALNSMIASLKDGADKANRKDAAGLAAAQNARFVDVASLGRETMQRAFVTSGRAGQDNEDVSDAEFRKILLGDLAVIKNLNIKQFIIDAIVEAFRQILPAPAIVMKELGIDPKVGNAVGNAIVAGQAGPVVAILRGLGIL